MRTKTFKMDKETGRLISMNDWENLEGLFFIVANGPKLGDRRVHRSEIPKVLKALYQCFHSALPLYLALDYKMYSVNIDILGNDVRYSPPIPFL